MVAIAAAVLVAFIGGLYFITHHKKEESEALQGNKVVGNGLPPKPEERWRYIKELLSRHHKYVCSHIYSNYNIMLINSKIFHIYLILFLQYSKPI